MADLDNALSALQQQIDNVVQQIKELKEGGDTAERLLLIQTENLLREEKLLLLRRHEGPKPSTTLQEELKQLQQQVADVQNCVKPSAIAQEELKQQMAEMHRWLLREQSVSISDVTNVKWEEIRAATHLRLQVLETRITPRRALKSAASVPSFGWTDQLEKAQVDRYGPHIQRCISLPRRLTWIDAANRYPSLLTTSHDMGLPFTLKGTTDYAALTKAALRLQVPLLGLKLMFELKKNVGTGTIYQAMVQLLLANMHTPEQRPVMVHTDLCDHWSIMWMDANTMWLHSAPSRFDAVAIIEDILEAPEAGQPASRGSAHFHEDESIFRIWQRRAFAPPPGAHGDNDVAALSDLADLLPEDEYKAAVAESVLRQFCNIPVVASMRSASDAMYC